MAGWASLCAELRLQIFEQLLADAARDPEAPRKQGLAAYSLVSRSWQAFFERELYRTLRIESRDLDGLAALEHRQRQRRLVRHVWLCVETSRYGCPQCHQPAGPRPKRETDEQVLVAAVTRLLKILAAWGEPEPEPEPAGGLTLELAVFSPSDRQHFFQSSVYFDSDGRRRRRQAGARTEGPIHDPRHGWVMGRQTDIPDLGAVAQLQRSLQPEFCLGGMPVARAVTRLVLRRQTRCRIWPRAMHAVIGSLPNLEHLVYEPWRSITMPYVDDLDMFMLVSVALPPSLKTLTMFEDFNEDFLRFFGRDWLLHGRSAAADGGGGDDGDGDGHGDGQGDIWRHLSGLGCPEHMRTPSDIVGTALAKRSTSLEHVCASFLVETRVFFQQCRPHWTWPRLRLLTLTSRLLAHAEADAQIADEVAKLLAAAAGAALRMPRLERLEIWCARRWHGAAFRYQVAGGRASIGWRGVWALPGGLDGAVAAEWQAVARARTGRELVVVEAEEGPLLERLEVPSHAAGMRALGISGEAAHPASLAEIDEESNMYYYF